MAESKGKSSAKTEGARGPSGRTQGGAGRPPEGRQVVGLVTALVTPLTAEGGLDEPGLDRLIERQVAGGADALFILGSVGEGPLVSDSVYEQTARRAAATVARRSRLLGGASDNSVERCLRRLEILAGAGVHYGVLTLPFYGWPGQRDHTIRFFSEIAAKSPLPVVAYNLPKAVGWQIPAEILEELFPIPNVIGIKDTHGDLAQMARVASSPARPAHFSYLPGNTALGARLLALGADGIVCTPANVFPEPFSALIRFHQTGRADIVRRMDQELVPKLTKLLDLLPTGAASIKGLLEADGVCGRHTVRPWPELASSDLPKCRLMLAEMRAAIAEFNASSRAATA
ncbi:MAG TPA: dihydrodipicolinate synthase family protein [Candidatus Baltobacteraceae bacterium]|nr:dihydrodipicolinate synthase family protein [Candidatus Baltobacteraceae bacterium]